MKKNHWIFLIFILVVLAGAFVFQNKLFFSPTLEPVSQIPSCPSIVNEETLCEKSIICACEISGSFNLFHWIISESETCEDSAEEHSCISGTVISNPYVFDPSNSDARCSVLDNFIFDYPPASKCTEAECEVKDYPYFKSTTEDCCTIKKGVICGPEDTQLAEQ